VVREGDVVRDHGKIARFQRELSPIQVGASGVYDKRPFRVAGVLRKGRSRVRWNEWFITFEDGDTGWLGEGNGQWFVYGAHYPVSPSVYNRQSTGDQLEFAGVTYVILEDAEAELLAAEGELPFAVSPTQRARYFDLRGVSGAQVGTLDFSDSPPTLWTGRDVSLVDLKMEGLRPFSGWSDPVLVQFAGPEITNVRTLSCDACGGAVPVRAPGQTQRLACSYCGSVLELSDEGGPIHAELLNRAKKPAFEPTLALGKRGTFDGVEREIIGAMVRSVTEDGMDWSWVEYLLYNPYRGFAWLICDPARHWSLATPITGAVPSARNAAFVWQKIGWRRFQGGVATVRHVLGEFTWEVAVGDRADTVDYIAPPRMLSYEAAEGEITWTVGDYLPVSTVEKAFKVDLAAANGVAPHQPNPSNDPVRRGLAALRGGVLFAIAAVLALAAIVGPDRATLFTHEYLVTEGDNAWVTDAMVLEEDSVVEVSLGGTVTGSPDVVVSFVNAESGEAWSWTGYGNETARASLPEGTWNGRVEVPAGQIASGDLNVWAVRDPGYPWPALLLLLYAAVAPLVWSVQRGQFEAKRWENGGT
jgi:hypothetical protein